GSRVQSIARGRPAGAAVLRRGDGGARRARHAHAVGGARETARRPREERDSRVGRRGRAAGAHRRLTRHPLERREALPRCAQRTAHEAVQPEVVLFGLRLAQSKPIYQALVVLEKSPDFERLDSAQRRIVRLLLRDARLSGIGLEGAALARYQAIATELAELS